MKIKFNLPILDKIFQNFVKWADKLESQNSYTVTDFYDKKKEQNAIQTPIEVAEICNTSTRPTTGKRMNYNEDRQQVHIFSGDSSIGCRGGVEGDCVRADKLNSIIKKLVMNPGLTIRS